MNPNRLIPIILLPAVCAACQGPASHRAWVALTTIHASDSNAYPSIGAIPVPEGFTRVAVEGNSFAAWLRNLPLKKDKTVYLYNGEPKRNQEAQFAVLDISVNDPSIEPGHSEGTAPPRDLQQCADAVMRLRAEYLYSRKDFGHIEFRSSQGTRFNFAEWLNGRRRDGGMRKSFGEFMQIVFTYCGSLSLERQLAPGGGPEKLQIGDVLVHGGSPGHVMLVIDMAVDKRSGKKIYLLAQGYMPAQDIHIVRNIYEDTLNPWYPADGKTVYTPEYTFYPGEARTWIQ